MAITNDDVKKIAKLARIEVSDEQVVTFRKQLSDILSYIEELNEVDTKDVPVTAQATNLQNIMRPDVLGNCDDETRQAALAQAPDLVENLVRVKAVFK